MIHPLLVTRQLAEMNMDMVCLQTGVLHDVVEDTAATLEEVRKEFGEEVARCVDGVTKLSKLDLASREERQAESVRKMLLAMVNDIRVILVKLADRLPQHAHAGVAVARAAGTHSARDHRNLCAHRAPARHGKNSRRA
jgi:GTP pyrophosphokinase